MLVRALIFLATLGLSGLHVAAQDTLGLANGFLNFNSSSFKIALVKDSQTLYSLKPAVANSASPSFDFVPSDFMSKRAANGNYHLGDIYFRARTVGSTAWTTGDSSVSRKKLTALAVSGSTIAAANLAPTLPTGSLLDITRRWVLNGNNALQLLFDVTNSQTTSVEIGAIGAPLEFNNIFTTRTAAQTNNLCSLFDPYIGQDAGYVQVTPLLGTLPPLLVTPVGKSPLEGWRFLPENTGTTLGYQSQTFEALYEWSFHTLAYSQNEWAKASPWNAPTSVTLSPGQKVTYGIQFNLAPSIRNIESTLDTVGRPVTVGIPGYVAPTDSPVKLFLKYSSAVASITVSPAGALTWKTNTDATSPWVGYTITGVTFGRSRLTITYQDGTVQTVHYYTVNPAVQQISNLGSFLTNQQWYSNTSDPFRRAPSVMSYDGQVNNFVLNDPRVWISGLSDEGGAGSWLAANMKQYVQPSAAEVSKLQTFIAQTLWGSIQNTDGTVKKSVFFYQPGAVSYTYPSNVNWGNWWSWNKASAYATDRAYDYVHVANAYWSIYRVARNYPSLVTTQTWQWYLNQAFLTIKTCFAGSVGYTNVGLMGETVFRYILNDLIREGLTANAATVQNLMKARQTIWAGQRFPFGSEMAWDSTGQEGVYTWSTFFNDSTSALNTINSIIAYEPTVPHWGYNGNARRYWDNIYGGKLMRIERQIHHYGSGLNSLPLLTHFQANPSDTYLLRVGYGGISGPLTNIDSRGFASASFHSFEDTLQWDGFSGDYGPNFVGLSLGSGMFLANLPTFGWQAFGGIVTSTNPTVSVTVTDAVRRRIFIAALGQRLELDAGAFTAMTFDPSTRTVTVTIAAAPSGVSSAAAAPRGRLLVQQTVAVSGVKLLAPTQTFTVDAGAFVIPFTNGVATVTLVA